MSSTPERPERIKRRADMACVLCRKRKLKCQNTDNEAPCERCKATGSKCIFVSVAEDPTGKSSRTPSCDSTDDSLRTQNSFNVPTTSSTQTTHPVPLTNNDRPANIAMPSQATGPFSPSYTPLDQGPYLAHSSRPTRKGPPTPGDRSGIDNASFSRTTEGPVYPSSTWSSSSAPTYSREPGSYHYHDSTLPPMSAPSTPSYHYSPAPNLAYGQDFHGSDQHPRALHATHPNPYYNQADTSQEGSHHSPYSTNQQPTSGIPGYPQPHSSNSSSLDTNHYYNQYSR